jgi:hypothetical protein
MITHHPRNDFAFTTLSPIERALTLVGVFSSPSNRAFFQSGMNLWQKSTASQNICVTFILGHLLKYDKYFYNS